MKRIARWVSSVFVAALLLAGGLFEFSTHVVRGWLRGEAFYDGRPTSWWRCELERWTARGKEHDDGMLHPTWEKQLQSYRIIYTFTREATFLEKQHDRWLAREESLALIEIVKMRLLGPKLLRGDEAAIPVLQQLLNDPSLRIRRFAQIGLKLKVEHSEDDE